MDDAPQDLPPAIVASERRRLPDRRLSETRRIGHRSEDGRETHFYVTLGYAAHDPLRPREVFYDAGFRSGADLAFLVQDAAVLISLLLQHGLAPTEIGRSLSALGDGGAGSVIGSMVAGIAVPPQWAQHAPSGEGDP
jgi:hypothetical protein